MAKNDNKKQQTNLEDKDNVEVFVPDSISVLYTDSAFIAASKFGVTVDFAQRVGNTKRQKVVARVGMSREHAEALLGVLQKKLIDMQTDD
jgi:sucrose-6-phosphate hydrolase SacC (GH32 family)